MSKEYEPMSDKKARMQAQTIGTRLMKMHTTHGVHWFLIPGGRVRPEFATEFMGRPDVVEFDDGLFPGNTQSWKIS